jgi:NitT/TauT family transport system ATP-binding protein
VNDPSEPIVRIDGVSKRYRFGDQITQAIERLSLDIATGSFVSIVGPSGCGKSTLLQMIAGLNHPTGGNVRFHGRIVTGPPRGMLYVFQQYEKSIFPWRTVIDNVGFGIESLPGLSKADRRERCMAYLKIVGLERAHDRFPAHLSGGMQQRVAIARALICEPEVLLMDEPFSAVDALTRATLQDLLLDVRERINLTILFVTHDVEEAVYLSTHVAAMTRSPAVLDECLAIDLPYPRSQIATRESPKFIAYRHHLFSRLFAQEREQVVA